MLPMCLNAKTSIHCRTSSKGPITLYELCELKHAVKCALGTAKEELANLRNNKLAEYVLRVATPLSPSPRRRLSDETAHSALPVRSTKDQWARPLIQLLRDLFLWRSRSALSPQSRAGRARGIRASFIIQPLYRLTNFRMQLCPR
ncbi:hypothetical protein EVAR_12666_1 [Eumeta japonica]|uniref:Uncharacterized protein n=1 Tax=Eumeta variegata TaxID=151549 RepID=A0A4C1YZT1_EUMVA|nr:hypothetical protein EVAR_12666_1 [Eumeta japonica]